MIRFTENLWYTFHKNPPFYEAKMISDILILYGPGNDVKHSNIVWASNRLTHFMDTKLKTVRKKLFKNIKDEVIQYKENKNE
jgi:hypothetical protein